MNHLGGSRDAAMESVRLYFQKSGTLLSFVFHRRQVCSSVVRPHQFDPFDRSAYRSGFPKAMTETIAGARSVSALFVDNSSSRSCQKQVLRSLSLASG